MYLVDTIYEKMVEYYRGDPGQIQHFVKVHSFASLIGRMEQLDEQTQLILELAALVHDIGIKPALAEFGSSAGPLQETMGPPVARKMLAEAGLPQDIVDRVCYLVSRHHTYTDVDGLDYRILLEADYLVNCYESSYPREAAEASIGKVFHTVSGIRLQKTMFAIK